MSKPENPIYANRAHVSDMAYEELRKTGRPIVLISGDPKNHVMDNNNISLRDHLAGQALMGLIAGRNSGSDPNGWFEKSYYYADRMLAERTKTV